MINLLMTIVAFLSGILGFCLLIFLLVTSKENIKKMIIGIVLCAIICIGLQFPINATSNYKEITTGAQSIADDDLWIDENDEIFILEEKTNWLKRTFKRTYIDIDTYEEVLLYTQ